MTRPGSQPDTFPLIVAAKDRLADGVVALDLADPAGADLPAWEPGAHIDLVLGADPLGDDLVRQYSLCGDPRRRAQWRVAVLREPEGRGGSAHVHDRLRVGDTVRARGPRNHFPLVAAPEYLFVAGGIGITPLLPMITEVAASGRPWHLLYGGRTRTSMAFLDELPAEPDRIAVRPQDEFGLLELSGLLGVPRPGVQVYCCGPEPLLAAVETLMTGWPPDALQLERFAPKPHALEGIDGINTSFVVKLDYSELEVTVRPDQSIVQAVEELGIEVVTSCREGTCGTCETAVLGGVPDHRDSVLSDAEHATNEVMMICCSRSRSPVLVLDL